MTVGAVGKNGKASKANGRESKNARNESKKSRNGSKNRPKRGKRRKPAPGVSGCQLAALGIIATVIVVTVWLTKSPEVVKAATIPLMVAVGLWAGRNFFEGLGK
jgi:hypothetical protein